MYGPRRGGRCREKGREDQEHSNRKREGSGSGGGSSHLFFLLLSVQWEVRSREPTSRRQALTLLTRIGHLVPSSIAYHCSSCLIITSTWGRHSFPSLPHNLPACNKGQWSCTYQ